MAETRFTPGPWEYDGMVTDDHGHGWFVRPCAARTISVEGRTDEEADANAHLIAAAPDLYNALNRIMDYAHTGASVKDIIPEDQPQFIAAYAALAKARGET